MLTVSALADFDGKPGGEGSATCREDVDDTLAEFSNWGDAVDIAAPGVCILSTYPLEQGEYGTISGTSMASPHAAGALALLASANDPDSADDVYGLYSQVIMAGNYSWTDDSGDGLHEPLLDVSLFAPVLVAAAGTDDDDDDDDDEIELSVSVGKERGSYSASLTWQGAESLNVEVYRDESLPVTTVNDGEYTDPLGRQGGSASYQVCEVGLSDIDCSDVVTVNW